jgi:hypothetical protein
LLTASDSDTSFISGGEYPGRKQIPTQPRYIPHMQSGGVVDTSSTPGNYTTAPPYTPSFGMRRTRASAAAAASSLSPSWYKKPVSNSAAARDRSLKDEFLVKSKLAGMTYKEIRRRGRFTEAESTLRGRFRTLTKHKDARVRKPEWTENDVSVS